MVEEKLKQPMPSPEPEKESEGFFAKIKAMFGFGEKKDQKVDIDDSFNDPNVK